MFPTHRWSLPMSTPILNIDVCVRCPIPTHNAHRGFFFAHVGWLMMKKHPEVLRRGKQVNFSDLFEDPLVVVFEK
jgi:fatty-acid desaturase